MRSLAIIFALLMLFTSNMLSGTAKAACVRGAAGCGVGVGHHGAGAGARGTPANRGGPVNRVGRR